MGVRPAGTRGLAAGGHSLLGRWWVPNDHAAMLCCGWPSGLVRHAVSPLAFVAWLGVAGVRAGSQSGPDLGPVVASLDLGLPSLGFGSA